MKEQKVTVEWAGRVYSEWAVGDLLAKGVPQAEIDTALAKLRGTEASRECRRRIYSLASAETQMNMATVVSVISGKTASARSDDEKAIYAGQEAVIAWVAAMRAKVPELAADPGSDITADES